jgi:hypothetical protein
MALNLALMVLLVAAVWRLWGERDSARSRQVAVVGQALDPVEIAPSPPVEPPEPVLASDYIETAQQILFFQDRNPNVVIEAAPPKPLPPMPFAHGVLDIGSGPTVILSKESNGQQQAYLVGDRYEDFRIAEITPAGLVFEWEGDLIRRSIEELKPADKEPSATPQPTARTKPAAAKPKSAILGGDSVKPGPGDTEVGGGMRNCRPGDASAPGTVIGGYRKVISKTPFGENCRWEPAQ